MKTEKFIIMAKDTQNGKEFPEYPITSEGEIVGFNTIDEAQAAIARLNRPSPWAEQFNIVSNYRIATVSFYANDRDQDNIDNAIMDTTINDLRRQGR